MQIPFRLLVVFILLNVIPASCLATQKNLALSPRILSAKTVYFEDKTGVCCRSRKYGACL